MAERLSRMTDVGAEPALDKDRLAEIIKVLELMAAGDTDQRLKISDRHDELDAIAYGINVLVGELDWATTRILEAQKERTARAELANASKTVFIGNMSHEIRTPITAMWAVANRLALGYRARPDRPDLLYLLRANGRAVQSLLDDLLDWTRLDADKVVLTPESVSVVELVSEVLASLEIDNRAKGLRMRVEAAAGSLGAVRTDRYRLRQILVNMLANAIKFTDTGSIIVSLHATVDGERWTIDITDTGVGIAADRHQRLFEPFEQANASITRAFGGHGLGLALSRRLAAQLGGDLVLLHSTPGEGSTFRLTLKGLEAPAPGESVLATEGVSPDGESLRGAHVLVAEDHRDLHWALRQALERAGATVESAHDGQEAVTKAASKRFDVVLMDLRMPHMDGLEATRTLRHQGYIAPIVALTADPASQRGAALEAGRDACLPKPFRLDGPIATVRQRVRSPTA